MRETWEELGKGFGRSWREKGKGKINVIMVNLKSIFKKLKARKFNCIPYFGKHSYSWEFHFFPIFHFSSISHLSHFSITTVNKAYFHFAYFHFTWKFHYHLCLWPKEPKSTGPGRCLVTRSVRNPMMLGYKQLNHERSCHSQNPVSKACVFNKV